MTERSDPALEGGAAKKVGKIDLPPSRGPQTITGAFHAISDSLNAARDNPRAGGGLRATGPRPEVVDTPPVAPREAAGRRGGRVERQDEAIPCQYVSKRASGPCAALSQVACPLWSTVVGHGCDCGLRYCLVHASRVKDAGKHWVDEEAVPARKVQPLGVVITLASGATPLDLPPREVTPSRPAPTCHACRWGDASKTPGGAGPLSVY